MPRIDPLQLLKCLSVLLSPEGGILSRDEVPRLVNLMTKFSKKLVSKCVYVLILKNTESSLVDLFMAEGGWTLIHTWLQDAMQMSNWDLVKEILSLLLVTPVDVERLKLNNIPKLVKNLSRREDLTGVQQLSSQLVQHWLVIVKSSNTSQEARSEQIKSEVTARVVENGNNTVDNATNLDQFGISTNSFYKLSVRDGKHVICKLPPSEDESKENVASEVEVGSAVNADGGKKSPEKNKSSENKISSSNSSRSSSSSKSSSSRSSKDKRKSSSSKSSSSNKDRSRDRDRDKDRKDKDRHRSNGSSKSSSSKSSSSSKEKKDSKDPKDKEVSKETKEQQAEKDKDTLAKIRPQSLDKLGRIPKKSGEDKSKDKDVKKKPTMSIEVRKNNEERPKTVKIFNSKMRSTGLEEEVKPPPPRTVKKSSVTLPTALAQVKRSSPTRDLLSMPPEKKIKVDVTERPGAIKLIPPKPKPPVLLESDIFMDALTASASSKKEPKKRKRRLSLSKDTPTSSANEPPSPMSSPLGLKNIAPINFYQDTLAEDSNGDKENNTSNDDKNEEENDRSCTPTDADEDGSRESKSVKFGDGPKGVLLYSKKKGPKRSISWKNDTDLVEIRYFELDETERVNVTKTFMDMAKMDITGEREALQASRKLTSEDVMEPQTMWKIPITIDQADLLTPPGSKSLEKDIQFAREKSVLQALYFDKRKIPDSAEEPLPENHQMSDPVTIPLEDSESQEIDMRNTPWPEPKGEPPHVEPLMPPQVFANMPPGPFTPNFPQIPPPGFPGMPPRFNGPIGPGNFVPPNMLPNGNMMVPPNMGPPPDMMNHQGPPINPNMFGGPPGPDGFPNENQNSFSLPFTPPPNMNMFPPNNFNMNRGGVNRGGFRRGGGNNNNSNGPWVRMNGPGNWNRGGGGGHHRGGGRLCKNIKNHGYCRNRDNCPFMHP